MRERFTADEVLKHPWIRNGAPETKLQTPGNLFRYVVLDTWLCSAYSLVLCQELIGGANMFSKFE